MALSFGPRAAPSGAAQGSRSRYADARRIRVVDVDEVAHALCEVDVTPTPGDLDDQRKSVL